MTIVRLGSTGQYADNFEQAFGKAKKKPTTKKPAAKKAKASAKKKSKKSKKK